MTQANQESYYDAFRREHDDAIVFLEVLAHARNFIHRTERYRNIQENDVLVRMHAPEHLQYLRENTPTYQAVIDELVKYEQREIAPEIISRIRQHLEQNIEKLEEIVRQQEAGVNKILS